MSLRVWIRRHSIPSLLKRKTSSSNVLLVRLVVCSDWWDKAWMVIINFRSCIFFNLFTQSFHVCLNVVNFFCYFIFMGSTTHQYCQLFTSTTRGALFAGFQNKICREFVAPIIISYTRPMIGISISKFFLSKCLKWVEVWIIRVFDTYVSTLYPF